ncbi:hypothetical protein B9Z65_7480 [Elsinoe australis]|uniref:Glucose-methanol-choline oxidoreductase N-terminal domain-containing protein n=1 Tax=Elsinoe australis TaxID=40998 RepID=A0A2P7YCA6_9PEZI|nr:hypothetical protein B9Z65_7480 [Elsinoe australis]
MTDAEYDFIVVGGGTAGCCIAGRLAENPNVSILVIEAGADNPMDHDKIRIPGAGFGLIETGHDWAYESTMVDRDDCRRYEKNTRGRGATFHDEQTAMDLDPEVVGTRGPLDLMPAISIPLAGPLRTAWEDRVAKYRGVRTNSTVYLEGKSNITIKSRRRSKKIIIEDGIAVGVQVQSTNGLETYRAKYEVIVSQGVYESPKLLMHSGIGPQQELRKHGIDCIGDSYHVGKNLIDHPVFPHVVRVKDGNSIDAFIRPGPQHDKAVKQHTESRTGPLCSRLLEIAAFPHIADRLKVCREWREESQRRGHDPLSPSGQPHFELDFIPAFAKPFLPHVQHPPSRHYLTVVVDLLRPFSRGEVMLRSNDPLDDPAINENFLAHPLDIIGLREGIRFTDELLRRGEGMKQIVQEDYPEPLPLNSDEQMHEVILKRVTTGYHPCGTCRLGKNIDEGVVNGNLKVYGVKKLRVIDASIDPVIPDCRPQQVVHMTAEKGSDMIKREYPSLYPELASQNGASTNYERKLSKNMHDMMNLTNDNK